MKKIGIVGAGSLGRSLAMLSVHQPEIMVIEDDKFHHVSMVSTMEKHDTFVNGQKVNDLISVKPPEPYLIQSYKEFERDRKASVPKKLRGYPVTAVRNSNKEPKVGRNKPCPCGSGLKYKKCCLKD